MKHLLVLPPDMKKTIVGLESVWKSSRKNILLSQKISGKFGMFAVSNDKCAACSINVGHAVYSVKKNCRKCKGVVAGAFSVTGTVLSIHCAVCCPPQVKI